MEAMAMGLPTIGSRWSGNLDFMNDGNSWLVDGELVPVAEDAELFPTHLTRGHNWFEPDVDSLAAALREVAFGGDGGRARAAGARAELIERFGTDAIVDRIVELASDLFERRSRPFACAIRGPFGSNASLAVVNDGIGAAIEARGSGVLYRGANTDMVGESFPGVSHSWPPNFDAVTMGPNVLIMPWEYGSPPKEWVEEVNARAAPRLRRLLQALPWRGLLPAGARGHGLRAAGDPHLHRAHKRVRARGRRLGDPGQARTASGRHPPARPSGRRLCARGRPARA